MSKKILINAAYLRLIVEACEPDAIIDGSDFAGFINRLKDKLRAQGRMELLNSLIREEVHMFETEDRFI